MTAPRRWTVYVKIATPALQDPAALETIVRTLESHDGVSNVAPIIGSLGRRSSVEATLTVSAAAADTAAERARDLLYRACIAAGYTLGRILTVDLVPIEDGA